MKIFVIGATGMTGSAFIKTATQKGFEIIANGRSKDKLAKLQQEYPAIKILPKDAFELTSEDFDGSDVIIDAFASAPDKAYLHVDLAAQLVKLFRQNNNVRLGFILGAGSLTTGDDHHAAVRDIEADESTLPWRAVPQNQYKELKFLQDVNNVNWFGVSPGLEFIPGEQSQKILYGENELLFNNEGRSVTTAGTMATVLVDEISTPKYHQQRFTVANG